MCRVDGSTSLPSAVTMNGNTLAHQAGDEADVAAEAVELGDANGNLQALRVL